VEEVYGEFNRVYDGEFSSITIVDPTTNWRLNNCSLDCDCPTHKGSHNGIDLLPIKEGYKGDPILASISGKIVYYKEGKSVDGRGTTIKVVSLDGKVETWYQHLDRILVAEGQLVLAGTIIAEMGNTGRYSSNRTDVPDPGTHLHFEVWCNGKRENPIKFLGK